MDSPLAIDKETVKEFKIPKEVELHPRQKLAFLEEQLQQLQAMHFRARIDVLHAKRLINSETEALKHKGLQNIDQHTNEVKQTVGAIQMLQKLIAELKAENEGVEAGEHPEN